MTKYSFIVFHRDTDEFLKSLQDLGVVDVTRSSRGFDPYSHELFDKIQQYKDALKVLYSLKAEADKNKTEIPQLANITSKINSGDDLIEIIERRLSLKESLEIAAREASISVFEAKPWGEFNPHDIDKIRSLGYELHFFTMPQKKFNQDWINEYPVQILNEANSYIYFVVLGNKGDTKVFNEPEAKFPELPYTYYEANLNTINSKNVINNEELLALTNYIQRYEDYISNLSDELELYMASNSNVQREADENLIIFEAFAPTENDQLLEDYLNNTNVYFLKDKARTEDNPPVKLKNNFFSKLYEPIGDLYMLPKYGELDLTPYFAPFYMLFFGLCLGDMGYGLVLMIAGLIVNFKVPKFKNYGRLVMFLGFGSIIMPALNGTIFGTKLWNIFNMSEQTKSLFFSDMKMFWFAIIIGLVQIVFARLVNAFFRMKTIGFTAGLSNIGWSICVTWAAIWYASSQMGAFEYPSWLTYIGWGGLALILFFSSENKNILLRVFKGTTSLYDATSIFGDMLSYIRLFGLGTAGGILGFVVDSVAMQMSGIPYVGWFFALLMLLIGHTAVIFLSSLGAFVHPMRLTFVEFYKNAGFEGGGRAFSPLTKTKKENN